LSPQHHDQDAPGESGRLRRLLALLAECHDAVAAATDETDLADRFCRALSGPGGYSLVCAALQNEQQQRLVAIRGMEEVWGDVTLPSEWAELDRFPPLAAFPGTLSLPLESRGRALGRLRIYAANQAYFSTEEHELLQDVATLLALGLAVLRVGGEAEAAARREAGEALRLRDRALESSCNGIMITSATQLDHPITYVNPAFERITGYSAAEVAGRNGRFLVRDDLQQKGLNEIRSALRDRREGHAVLRNYRKDGSLFWNELHLAPVLDESGQVTTHFVSVINDVSERIRYQEQLEYQATHDVLTGLANRSLLADRIAQAINLARRDRRLVGVMLLDLDRFKVVNDGLGHAPADTLLKTVSERLKTAVRDTDTVARLGGDEFVIVVGDLLDAEDAAVVAGKIQRALAQPLLVEGKELFVTASIGISLFPRDGETGDILLRNADVAMYRVKEYGRNNYRFYLPEMSSMALDRLDMEGNLRRALETDEFQVYYQPKVSLRDGTIVGAEALLRWMHPRIGQINPSEFIPLAEESGLIIPLGEKVLEMVCQQISAWREEGLPSLKVAINISARQFRQENLGETVRRLLTEYQVPGEMLDIELTESMVMHDTDHAALTLRELKDLGVTLSLDDFGTGYSSLSYLKRFPIDCLKIDRSFVRDINTNPDDAAIAHAVIAMAHSLSLNVVAEGVETEEQLRLLQSHGCDEFQGYYFSRAVPATDYALLISQGKTLADLEAQRAAGTEDVP
jgi:diguanylate cyclase (GGDEF)-like protein/PAS domain S-box-containing protein